ncbi:MAG: CRISPR-associated endoribonuclease Cas6 [Clostridia bacterium]
MKIKMCFKLENNILPIEYRQPIISFFKHSVEKYDKDIYEKLFNKENNACKFYTFYVRLDNPKFDTNTISLNSNNFSVFLSSYSQEELTYFYDSLILAKDKSFPLNKNKMTMLDIKYIEDENVQKEEIVVRFLSPFLVRTYLKGDSKNEYLTYEDNEFEDTLKTNIENSLNNLKLDISLDGFEIKKIKPKKTVIKLFNTGMLANLGIYSLKGNLELLNFLKLSGIGLKRGSGFGYFDIIG